MYLCQKKDKQHVESRLIIDKFNNFVHCCIVLSLIPMQLEELAICGQYGTKYSAGEQTV